MVTETNVGGTLCLIVGQAGIGKTDTAEALRDLTGLEVIEYHELSGLLELLAWAGRSVICAWQCSSDDTDALRQLTEAWTGRSGRVITAHLTTEDLMDEVVSVEGLAINASADTTPAERAMLIAAFFGFPLAASRN